MLLLAGGGTLFYSFRKTGELLEIGAKAHALCAVAGAFMQSDSTAGALGSAAAMALGATLVTAGNCSAGGRDYSEIVLRQDSNLISLAFTQHGAQEIFPRALAGRRATFDGVVFHMADSDGYAVAAAESAHDLAYVVSSLPDERNARLAALLAPLIRRRLGE